MSPPVIRRACTVVLAVLLALPAAAKEDDLPPPLGDSPPAKSPGAPAKKKKKKAGTPARPSEPSRPLDDSEIVVPPKAKGDDDLPPPTKARPLEAEPDTSPKDPPKRPSPPEDDEDRPPARPPPRRAAPRPEPRGEARPDARGEGEEEDDAAARRRKRSEGGEEGDDEVEREGAGVKRRGFGIERVGPLSGDLLFGPQFMGFGTGFETHFDLGLALACDIGDVGFGELRYQHAGTSLSNGTLGSDTGYHTFGLDIALGVPLQQMVFGYGLFGLDWELTRVTHTLSGNWGTGEWSSSGSHFGILIGGGARVRIPGLPVEARLELDYKRRGQFNDFVIALMAGGTYDWKND